MRAGCAAVVFFAFVLAAGIGFLAFLRGFRPDEDDWTRPPRPPVVAPSPGRPPVTAPTPVPDHYLPRVGSLNRFQRTEAAGRYRLSFGFIDHHGRPHEVTCAVDAADHRSLVAGFGFDDVALDREVGRRLETWLSRELASRGLAGYVALKVEGSRISAEPTLPESLDVEEHNRLVEAIRMFYRLWDGPLLRRRQDLEAEAYRERGFLLEGDKVRIDYAGVARRGRRPLGDCFQALERASPDYNQRQFLGLVLAFFQEIHYEVPPGLVNGLKSLGLWVPSEVLVNNHGDCDSKAVAFAAMWRSLDAPVVFISVPRHMLIGVEMKPGPGEKYVLIRNRYFVLCEVAGPAKLHPGKRELSGHFQYVLMEPDPAAQRSAAAPGS